MKRNILSYTNLEQTNKEIPFYKVLFHPFISFMSWYSKTLPHVNFDPVQRGYALPMETLEELFEFRNKNYREVAPYLLAKSVDEVKAERWLDLNAFHIISRDKKGNINGVLRLLSTPFECRQQEVHKFLDLTPYKNFLEISRCVVSNRSKGVGKMLLIKAGVWAITQTNFEGFIAICRKSRLGMFNSFGLILAEKFFLKKRENEEYYFIQSKFEKIVLNTLGRQLKKLFSWA